MEYMLTIQRNPCLILDGYQYRIFRKSDEEVISWLCLKSERMGCRGMLKVDSRNNIVGRIEHLCTPNYAEIEVKKAMQRVKIRVFEETHLPVQQIYQEEFKSIFERGYDLETKLPSYSSTKTVLYPLRKKALKLLEQLEENADPVAEETKDHSSKKYSKDFQKSHHHGHKHKKNNVQKEQPKEEAKPKSAPVEVPEPDIQLQENIETSKNTVDQKRKEQTEDLHLQDLTYEENLKKEKKKKKTHHGAHHAEVLGKEDQKLFAEQEAKNTEKVIEDSFEPLKNSEGGKKNKGKDKKNKDRKNKKASEKNKDIVKKSKDGKNKNKDKKHKNKDKKKY